MRQGVLHRTRCPQEDHQYGLDHSQRRQDLLRDPSGAQPRRRRQKVILVDADFRVPSQIKSLVDITGYGLSDYLMDEHLPIEEAIYFDAKQHNLHYLPTRIEDRNPRLY